MSGLLPSGSNTTGGGSTYLLEHILKPKAETQAATSSFPEG